MSTLDWSSAITRVLIRGGLGNQLFQLTAGLLVSELHQSPLTLIYSEGVKGANVHGDSLKQIRTHQFSIREIQADLTATSVRVSTWLSRRSLAVKLLPYFETQELGYSPTVFSLRKGVTLIGYFQSYRYLEKLCSLRSERFVVIPRDFSNTLNRYLHEIKESNPIALHVRRGDYVGNKSTGLLSQKYYADSLELMNSRGRDVWVFSDDINGARELLGSLSHPNWKWIDSLNLKSSSQTLYAMSMFSDIIIANSTLSWWAASVNKTSKVIAPGKWFANRTDPIDLISPQWLRVESNWI